MTVFLATILFLRKEHQRSASHPPSHYGARAQRVKAAYISQLDVLTDSVGRFHE